jgi:hypothetical protein
MADKATFVLPRDPWPFSTVTVGDLEALVADGLLCPLSGDPQPECVAEPPELFQLKCLSHASGAVTHLNRNNPSVP